MTINKNCVIGSFNVVYLSSKTLDNGKTYYNATIVFNGFPVRVNVTKDFYDRNYDDVKKNGFVCLKSSEANLNNYKGAWNLTLL